MCIRAGKVNDMDGEQFEHFSSTDKEIKDSVIKILNDRYEELLKIEMLYRTTFHPSMAQCLKDKIL